MNKVSIYLSVLFAAQIALAGALWFSARSGTTYEPQHLLSLEQDAVNKIRITREGDEVTLQAVDGQWRLPDLYDLPVDNAKLSAVLDKLTNAQGDWPVATTASSHTRFEVSPEAFQRHIHLYSSDELLGEMFLGTSPGFRKVHARNGSDEEVFALGLNVYDFPAEASAWLERGLLAFADASTIEGSDYRLTRDGDSWQLETSAKMGSQENADPAATSELDLQKAMQLAAALAVFQVTGVADDPPEFVAEDTVTLAVRAGEKSRDYEFFAKDGQHWVRTADRELVFTLDPNDYQRTASVGFADLLQAQTAELEQGKDADLSPGDAPVGGLSKSTEVPGQG